jgi:hypothetical protein
METAITPLLDVSNFRPLSSGKSRRVTVTPEQSGTVTLSALGTVDSYISIPSSKFSFINGQASYLEFDYTIAGTTTPAATTVYPINLGLSNGDAGSVIKTLELTCQGQSVHQLDNYGAFSNLMFDMQNGSRAKNVGSILSGALAPNYNTAITDANPSIPLVNLLATKQPYAHTTGETYRACIPLYDPVLGVLAESMVHASEGYRLRISFTGYNQACIGHTVTGMTIANIKLQLDYVDVMPDVLLNLAAEGGGTIKSHCTGVNNYNVSGSSADTAFSYLVPARFSSVKFIMNIFRRSAAATAVDNFWGARIFPFLDQLSINIGGRQYPPTAISHRTQGTTPRSTGAEAFMEFTKILSQLHSPAIDCVFAEAQYLQTQATTSATVGSFASGLMFEEYSGVSRTVSGVDTQSSNMIVQATCSAGVGANYQMDSFVGYDMVIEVDVATGQVSFSK